MDSEFERLLIVWVYFPAVGHFVEAIDVAAGYKKSNPELKISLLVNNTTSHEVAKFCKWIDECIPVDVKDVAEKGQNAAIFQTICSDWDYIIFPKRFKYTPQDFTQDLLNCNKILLDHLHATKYLGYHFEKLNERSIPFTRFSSYRLELSEDLVQWANNLKKNGPILTLMFEGASSSTIYPDIRWWKRVIIRLKKELPEATLILTGRTPGKSENKRQVRTKQFKQLQKITPGLMNYYDIELDRQMALIQISDVFISPHSGFAFLAPCLGTPWLCVSGGYWSEQMFARMPFYSLIPKCTHYPCAHNMKLECKLRMKAHIPVKCMNNSSNTRIDELIAAVKLLLEKKTDFRESIAIYKNLLYSNHADIRKIWLLKDFETNETSMILNHKR